MPLIIDELTMPDRRLVSEITEMVRQTSPELLYGRRPRRRSRRSLMMIAGVIVTASIALAAVAHAASPTPAPTPGCFAPNQTEMSS